MSSDSESASENLHFDANENLSIFIVGYLKQYKTLLEKSQLPGVKNKKKEIIRKLCGEYKEKTGVEISEKNVVKKIANMKCRVKSKSDKNKTGNKKIYLKKWEHELFELLSAESNPTIGKVTSTFSVGVNANESSSSNLESAVGINNDSSTSSAAVQNTPICATTTNIKKKAK